MTRVAEGRTGPPSGRFEVAVVGGGPAGSATALALATLGRRVAVLERSGDGLAQAAETLPPEVRSPLGALGLWDRFLADGPVASPGTVSSWGGPGLVEADHILNPFGCAWLVDRRCFDAMMISAAGAAGCAVMRPARLVDVVRRPSSGWRLETVVGGEPRPLRAEVLVDATGRSSMLSRRLGSRRFADDRLVGLVTCRSFTPGSDDDRRMLLEAVEDGWWYSFPRPGGGRMAAFMTDVDLLPRGCRAIAGHWDDGLRRAPHTAARLGGPDLDRARVRPAESSRLDRAVGSGWLAVGDAASAWDPLSSQGVHRALVAGLEAATAVDALLRGDRRALESYADRVAADHGDYLEMRSAYYGLVGRWAGSPFWRRRRKVAPEK